MNQQPPIAAEVIPPEWIEMIREIVARGAYELRGHPTLPRLEARNHLQNRWHTIMLYGSGYDFATDAERDIVLRKLL